MTNGCQIEIQRTKLGTPGPQKTRKMTGCHQRSVPSDDLDWPREGHYVSVNHECQLATPIHVPITSKNTEVRKFQALKQYGTQISLDMTLEIRSQVKDHSRYLRSWNFQGRCKIVQWIGVPSFPTMSRSVRELLSETRTWLHHPPPLCRRGCMTYDVLLWYLPSGGRGAGRDGFKVGGTGDGGTVPLRVRYFNIDPVSVAGKEWLGVNWPRRRRALNPQ